MSRVSPTLNHGVNRRSPRFAGASFRAGVGFFLGLLVLAQPTYAQTLPVAGEAQQFWQARQEEGNCAILLGQGSPAALTLNKVRVERGRLVPCGLAAGDGRLWLIYEGQLVQSLNPQTAPTGLMVYESRLEASLPAGTSVRSAVAGREGLWLLLRVETREALNLIDSSSAVSAAGLSAANTQPAAEAPRNAELPRLSVPEDRLVHLQRGQWVKQELPADWPHDAPAWMVLLRVQAQVPILAVAPKTTPGTLRVYRTDGEASRPTVAGWQRQDYPLAGTGTLQLLAVEEQLVLGQRANTASGLALDLSILRPGKVIVLGRLSVPTAPSAAPWALISTQQSAALIVAADPKRLLWSRMDVRGQRVGTEAAELTETQPNLYAQWVELLLVMGTVAIATLILFVFWRREGTGPKLNLSKEVVLADRFTRVFAGLIDLVPCLVLGSLVWGADPRDILNHWPGMPGAVIPSTGMLPPLTALLLLVIHTTLSELFTARTLGKALLGLRVTNFQGGPPHLWQVLARNLGRIFELLAPLFLILPFITPYQQRLCDLIAHTVVVQHARPPEPAGDDDDEDEE